MTWICQRCLDSDSDGPPVVLEFESEKEYKQHMGLHEEKDKRKGIETPIKKNKGLKNDSTGSKARKIPKILVKKLPSIEERPKLPPELTLDYKYKGICYSCGDDIDTIVLDVDGRTNECYAIAWCNSCKKKLKQRKVAKL